MSESNHKQKIIREIEQMVHKETTAWNQQDVETLLTLFHPDMVWPWPRTPKSHDPVDWVLEWGRYNYKKWKLGWESLFDTHNLVHNHRKIIKCIVSDELDAGFAVVDIDTLWMHKTTKEKNHWKGRVSKTYTKMEDGWKLIMHTGVLDYQEY